ncbi:MAG: hypothetical protein WAW86_09760 [Gammaproteobacteria bacterium]
MKLKYAVRNTFIGAEECSALSLIVYHDENEPAIPPNLAKLNISCAPKAGFYAEAYINKVNVQGSDLIECIIAFRGTNSFVDLIQDYLVLMDAVPDYFHHDAIPFINTVKKYVQEHYRADLFTYTYTGHSLGALLAQLCYCKELDDLGKIGTNNCIVFESPGAKTIVEKLIERQELPIVSLSLAHQYGTVYLSDVNAINTCHPQLGNIFSVDIPYVFESLPLPSMISYVKDFTFKNQHKMLGFFNYWNSNNFKQSSVIPAGLNEWPVGLKDGFDYYINYNKRVGYWYDYIKAMWDENPNWHDAYENNSYKFEADFKKKFLIQEWSKFYVLIDKLPAYSLFQKKHSYHVEIEKDALPKLC